LRRPELDPALVAVVTKAMSHDVSRRFQTAESMADALARWLVPKSAPLSDSRRSSPLAFAPTVDGTPTPSKHKRRRTR